MERHNKESLYEAIEQLKERLGVEFLLDEIAIASSSSALYDNLNHIVKMHNISLEKEG